MSRNDDPYSTSSTPKRTAAGLRTPHLVGLLVIAHAPLLLLWQVVPSVYSVSGVVAIPLVLGLAGLILLCYVLAYSGLARRIRHSGGIYVVVTQGLGRKVGLGTAALVFVGYLGVAAGFYGLLGSIIKSLVDSAFSVHLSTKVALFIGLAIVLIATRLSLRVVVWAAMVIAGEQVLVVLWFVVSAVRSPAGGHVSTTSLDPGWLLSGSFAIGLVFALTVFIGSEVGTSYSTEMADPARSVPKATYLSYGLTALLLMVGAWALSVTVGAESTPSTALKMGPSLMPALVTKFAGGGTWAVNLLLFNLMLGIIATAVTLNNTASRQLAGLARDGVLPASFAPRRYGDAPPTPATLVQVPIAAVFAFFGSYSSTTMVPQWLVAGAGLAIIGSLTLASAATAVWFMRGEADEGGFFGWEGQVIAGLISVVTTGGVFVYGVLRLRSVVVGAPPVAAWLVGTLIFLIFGAGVVGALILRATRPDAYAALGKGLLPQPVEGRRAELARPARTPRHREPVPPFEDTTPARPPAQAYQPSPAYLPPSAEAFKPVDRDEEVPASVYQRPWTDTSPSTPTR